MFADKMMLFKMIKDISHVESFMTALVPLKQPWRKWVISTCNKPQPKSTMQKPCVYSLVYNAHKSLIQTDSETPGACNCVCDSASQVELARIAFMALRCNPNHSNRHSNDVIMGVISSQITSLTIAYSTVYLGADQRKHQGSASLAFERGIHRWPVNSPNKWPITRKRSPFDDVIMGTRWSRIWSAVLTLYAAVVWPTGGPTTIGGRY